MANTPPMPKAGDRIYMDFGDSIIDGGEISGTVDAVEGTKVRLQGRRDGWLDLTEPVYWEVLG